MANDLLDSEGTIARPLDPKTSPRSELRLPVPRLKRLRAEIQQGTYHVPSTQLAEALIRSMLESDTLVN